MKGPEKYIQDLHITVPDLVEPGKPARIDSTQRTVIGHDFFYFSSPLTQRQFMANPLRYARRLTDPVTLRRFVPGALSPQTSYRGRKYYFADSRTLARFKAHPDSFAVRTGM